MTSPIALTARTPEDLLALVPAAIGYGDSESVVLLTFGSPEGSFHARSALPHTAAAVEEMTASFVMAVERNRPACAAVMVLAADPDVGQTISASLVPALQLAGVDVIDAVQADGEHWWEVPVYEPGAWVERHPYDVRSHPFTAELVFGGRTVYSSRDELEASIRPRDDAEAARFAGRVDARLDRLHADLQGPDAEATVSAEEGWLARLLATPSASGLTADDAARVVVLAQMSAVRDRLCLGLTRRSAADQLEVWRAVVARTPTPLVAGVASVLALVAWLSGDGALAWCAVDRCRQADPHHSLAAHVAAALQGAVPPSAWEAVRSMS